MIIDAKTIILSLIIMVIAFILGLRFIRAFALQIAQDNHDALLAMDQKEEEKRLKRERDADVAAASAFAKVQPILTTNATTNKDQTTSAPSSSTGESKPLVVPSPPRSQQEAVV